MITIIFTIHNLKFTDDLTLFLWTLIFGLFQQYFFKLNTLQKKLPSKLVLPCWRIITWCTSNKFISTKNTIRTVWHSNTFSWRTILARFSTTSHMITTIFTIHNLKFKNDLTYFLLMLIFGLFQQYFFKWISPLYKEITRLQCRFIFLSKTFILENIQV